MEPFLGQIMLCPYSFAPLGWADCNGQTLPIRQYTALFSLLGVQYGGDGNTAFALPDLRGRAAVSFGQATGRTPYALGQMAGNETATLDQTSLASHVHAMAATSTLANITSPINSTLATQPSGRGGSGGKLYAASPAVAMAATMSSVGDVQSHANIQPYVALRYVIAILGDFPQRP